MAAAPTKPYDSANTDRAKTWGIKILFFVLMFGLWQALVSAKFVKPYLFPGPIAVAQSFMEMAKSGELWGSIRLSMTRMLVGYSISVIGGLFIGVIAARSWLFKQTFGSIVLSLQSLPSVCWLPIAIIWVGIDERAVILVVILGALFSIAVATEGAIRNVPPIYLKVGQVLGARGVVFAKDILFYASLPELVGGLKLGWSFAWRSLMAAELVRGDIMGVGKILETGRQLQDTPQLFAGIITILLIGLTVDSLIFGTIERQIRLRWGLQKS